MSKSPKTLIIFLHGSGSNGDKIRKTITPYLPINLKQQNIDIIFPTAKNKCKKPNQWFCRSDDFLEKGLNDTEDLNSINKSLNDILQLIKLKQSQYYNIFIGGFSMGGGLTLYLNYVKSKGLLPEKVKGIFSIGSYLIEKSIVFTNTEINPKIPIYMMHGNSDHLINLSWGKKTYKKLLSQKYNVKMKIYPNMDHEINQYVIDDLFKWINSIKR